MKGDIYFYLGKSSFYIFVSFLIVYFILKKVDSKKTKISKVEKIVLVIGIACLLYFISR